jgi:hypothetical protein
MAQYMISRRCGHEQTVQTYGTNTRGERERKAEWLAQQDCPDCAGAQRAVDHQAEGAAATAKAIAAGLLPLEGTPKQVQWAESIRIRLFDDLRARCEVSPAHAPHAGEIVAGYMRVAAPLTDARTWIDNRHDPRAVLRARMTDSDRAATAAIQQQAKGQ